MIAGSSAGTGIVRYSMANHWYDPLAHVVRLAPAPGLPVPRGWNARIEFNEIPGSTNCTAKAHYSVDASGYLVADVSEYAVCDVPFDRLIISFPTIDYGCSGLASGSIYIDFDMAGTDARAHAHLECYSDETSPCR
jgi:hypothetical protein